MNASKNEHIQLGNLLAWHYERRRAATLALCPRYADMARQTAHSQQHNSVATRIAWNLLHVASRDDLVLSMFGQGLLHPEIAPNYDEGTHPLDDNPPPDVIVEYLSATRDKMAAFMRAYPPDQYGERPDPDSRRTVADWFVFRVEHEAYHRGKVRALLDFRMMNDESTKRE